MMIETNSKYKLIFIPHQFGVHQKLKLIREIFTKYNFISIPHQFGVHWWINIFVEIKMIHIR